MKRNLFFCLVVAIPKLLLLASPAMSYGIDHPMNAKDTITADKAATIIADSLKNISKRLPVEKVYLHTDKVYYNVGDTLWFKAYVTDGSNRASKYSALLYVEMYDDSAEVVRRISVPIKQGLGMAQIPLPRKVFKEGGYTLRAYTNWMQNFGSDYFFTHRFYLAIPSQATWLIRSTADIEHVGDQDRLNVDAKVYTGDRKPLSLSNLEVKIYDGRYYLFKEEMRTGIDGSLNFSKFLKNKVDGRELSIQITSLEKAYKDKVIHFPLVINRDSKIDLQFLPESGKLVAGISSCVGFKAIGEDGKGIDIKATILDSRGNKIADVSSLYKGMGSFKFTPQAGESYVARVSGARTNNKAYSLPAVQSAGIVMHIDNPEQGGDIKINIKSTNNINPDSCYHIQGVMNGRLYYAEKIKDNDNELKVNKIDFPTGIARFTVFKGLTQVAERAIFIDHKDRLDIHITPNKANYQKRDSVSLEIQVKDAAGIPVQGSFSLSVTDNSQVKPDTMNNFGIAAQLLLRSGLKGDIETPGYYLDRKDAKAWQALDDLMLTQGWTGYDWKEIFAPAAKPKFTMEKDLSVSGMVFNISNKPIPDVSVILSSQKPQYTALTFTDKDGRYLFNNLPKSDSASFFLQANNKKGASMTFGAISVDKIAFPYVPEMYRNPIMPWYLNSDAEQLAYVARSTQKNISKDPVAAGTLLKDVTVKKVKKITDGLNGRTDLAFDEKDIKESTTQSLYHLLKQKIQGFQIINDYVYHHGTPTIRILGSRKIQGKDEYSDYYVDFDLLFIDGRNLDFYFFDRPKTVEDYKEMLNTFLIPNLKSLEVAWSGDFISQINPNYYMAKIVISTLNNSAYYMVNRKPGLTTYRPLPVMLPKQFYSPRYGVNAAANQPDYRSTIHWEPQLYTDYNGKAKVWFYTSDLPKNYSINIQGISLEGDIGGSAAKFGL